MSSLLSLRGIGKRFPGVIALDNVSLEIGKGEVVALCGENGAGKSTLMKIVGGVYQPDDGAIEVDGKTVKIGDVNDSMALGIAFIHQELNVLDNLDVAANVFLGREPRNAFGLINFQKIHADTEPFLKRLGMNFSSKTPLEKLSIAEKQMVEIAKALSLNARIIIMDEPTSSLTLQETDRLLELVCELSEQGVSVIYISHRLGEVEHCADRVVVLRDGKNAGELPQTEVTHDKIVSLMVGREINSTYTASNTKKTPGYLKVRNAKSSRFPSKAVEFDAARGEILGFAGLVGAGRSEIMKAMVGLDLHGGAELTIGDERIHIHKPADAIGHGIYLVPEDRRGEGLVTAMTVRENTTLPSLERYSTFKLISKDRERKVTDEQIKSLNIKTSSGEAVVLNLSGGNQQKVVLGKWLSMSPKVMILDEPTRGIDVGAKAEIYRLMRVLADNGGVILMISSDMEEVLNVSDRIAVMHEGRITGMLEREHCNEENVMNLAVGKTIAAAKVAVN
ncbi:MAG TPA: sugar ABC transporter ATP-binding protein [Candidatus Sulfotelmatobacter sp.]|jgi:ribose transport system ATP-binding protein|nr:sugar ABC transporter ATP-binding protein [Candidatus Sulfotelmatobacter sp.]